MRQLAYTFLLSSLLVVGRAAAAPPVPPEKRAEARQHYENGSRKFDVAKYDEAAVEFEAAYEIIGDPVILFNIAQSYRLAQKYEKALLFYKNYLRRTGSAGNRLEVEKRIAELSEIVDRQKQASTGAPEGTLRPAAPPETAPEAQPAPPPQPEPTPPPAPEAPRPGPSKKLLLVGGVVAGVGVIALAVGGAMSALAGSRSDTVASAARGSAGSQPFTPALRDSEQSGKTFDAAGIALYAVGGAAVVAGAAVLGLAFKRPREARAQLTPLVGPRTAGLALGGSF